MAGPSAGARCPRQQVPDESLDGPGLKLFPPSGLVHEHRTDRTHPAA